MKFAKIEITGIIEIITGIHIGGSSAFSAIGAVDSPVIRDIITGYPMIPGSSLKGKLRALLAKRYNEKIAETPDDDNEELTDLFGSAKKNHVKTSRILFSDMILNWEKLKDIGLTSKTEIKFENNISRTTAVANPRQIERVIRGSEFPLNLIYEVPEEEEKMERDFEILKEGFKLLEYDYLGGNGSRGYGKVKIRKIHIDVVVGEVSDDIVKICQKKMDEV